ncbi:hypothetical protein ANCDUO_21484 [Ancylostoma duodenale]|uniref:PH domain-containing protein n=1 Tax=Ancylostoma duodenale TaxID=51022 RepID=A0A0C2CF78_9BILA|nr:hypothetical protein ANCDUO_21484 [Ancylostoma duodenale]
MSNMLEKRGGECKSICDRIAIENIREVRLGKNTEQLRLSDSNFGDLQDECLFSVIYGDDYETLDLVASCADDANIWVTDDCKPTTIAWATLRERLVSILFPKSPHPKKIGESSGTRNSSVFENFLLPFCARYKIHCYPPKKLKKKFFY